MSLLRQLSRKLPLNLTKFDLKSHQCLICIRSLSYTPMNYDETRDPAPIFIKPEVQTLLRTLTRVDLAKVYRKRRLGYKVSQPVYKFLTDEQLKETYEAARQKVDDILQLPPVVSVRKPRNRIISKDPALQGLDSSTFVFTDITYGIRDSDRIILLRDPEGTLKEADWDVRDRINQMYFPVKRREVRIPRMFEDEFLEDLLKRKEYVFILDRACLQFEPNDALYQKVTSITYQHINDNNSFEEIRSTRHFGGFAFFVTWHKMIDNLLLDLIESERIDEAKALVDLYSIAHNVKFENGKEIDGYIQKHSNKKAALELALQAYRNIAKQRAEVEEGIKKAHGFN